MFEKLDSFFVKKNKNKLNKKKIILGITLLTCLITSISIFLFNPGKIMEISFKENTKKITMPEISKSLGQKTVLESKNKDSFKKDTNTTKNMQNNFNLPFSLPEPNFYNRLPTTLPSFSNQPSLPVNESPSLSSNNVKFDSSIVYARHANLTTLMQDGLSPLFKLNSFSDAPKDNSSSRFITSYVISNNGIMSEKFELMSITKNMGMSNIKTAKEALTTLIEESDSVNIIEEADDFLIYDLSGSKGYQIGKISIDDQGIYILGYVNLTTNNMPTSLKYGWVEKLKKI